MKLKIELIPKTCWNQNIRSLFSKSEWDRIRKKVYDSADMICQICGEKCSTLDAHEVWDYDESKHIQKLVNIIGVCKKCHNAIHYGRAQKLGFEKDAREQFLKVNDCDIFDLQNHIIESKIEYDRRSKITEWKQDFGFLKDQGYNI